MKNTCFMHLYKAVALPLFLLTLQPAAVSGHHISPAAVVEAPRPKPGFSLGQGIDMIVKALGLNIDNIRFIKAPQATDYFSKANNKASYAPSLIIAGVKGMESVREQNPETPATRELFAQALYDAIQSTGQYPVNMMWIIIKDEKAFKNNGINAVQTLIKFNVVSLQNGNFRPTANITKAEAEQMVKKAAEFVASHARTTNADANANAGQGSSNGVTFTSTPVNDKVTSVVISAGEKPTSGYELHVISITFTPAKQAIIHYKLTTPPQGSMNLQVISEPKAEAFVPAGYQIEIKKEE